MFKRRAAEGVGGVVAGRPELSKKKEELWVGGGGGGDVQEFRPAANTTGTSGGRLKGQGARSRGKG